MCLEANEVSLLQLKEVIVVRLQVRQEAKLSLHWEDFTALAIWEVSEEVGQLILLGHLIGNTVLDFRAHLVIHSSVIWTMHNLQVLDPSVGSLVMALPVT
jgi:hypothetical protein